ncbi:MAG: type II toxin-antitoxin system HicB family antitoxin [Candidatus Micrarchaeales archaeon]|nr:type II toxin-antitoxin system HicB family antitoxin [Candidatus Micrarchaeales archaeon]
MTKTTAKCSEAQAALREHLGKVITVEFSWRGNDFLETSLLRGIEDGRLLLETGSVPFSSRSAEIRRIYDSRGQQIFSNPAANPRIRTGSRSSLFIDSDDDPVLKLRTIVTVNVQNGERARDESHTYIVELKKDEDGCYVAFAPKLKGCVSGGRNKSEALRNIREAIAGFIKLLRANGEELPVEDLSEIYSLIGAGR